MNKTQNPLHSPHIQALRQLIKHGYTGDIEDILEELEEDSFSNPEEIKSMNEEWNAILYSSKSIDHLMLSTFNYFPQIHKVSPEAQSILFIMVRTQEQATGLVEVPKTIYAKVLGWGSKRAGHIDNCLKELKEINAILPIYEPPKGSKKSGIYQINPNFSKIGKGFQVSPINKKTAGEYVQYPDNVTILINGNKKELRCGSIRKIIDTDQDKKRASAGLADSKSKPHTGSEPQDNSTRDTRKNQVNNNMPNTESLLTPEEELMFSGTLSGTLREGEGGRT